MLSRYLPILGTALIFLSFSPASNAEMSAEVRHILDTAASHRDGAALVDTAVILRDSGVATAEEILAAMKEMPPIQRQELAAALGVSEIPQSPPTLAAVTTDVEPAPAADETEPEKEGWLKLGPWDGSAELGVSSSTGDTREKAFALGIQIGRTFNEIWEHKFDLTVDLARRAGVTSKELYLADYQLFYRKWERTYLFSRVNFEDDRFSGFQYRFAESAGVGYQLFDSERFKWSLDAGPGLRQTRLDTGELRNEFIAVANSGFRYFFSDTVNAGNETHLYFGQDRTSVENIVDLKARLNSALSARFSFNLRFDSEVPPGTRRMDTLTKVTVVYDF